MKKIIVLSISLLFSSIQAQELSEVEIDQVAETLMHNAEFIENCRALCKKGFSLEQIVEQLIQSDALSGPSGYPVEFNEDPIPLVISIVVVMVIAGLLERFCFAENSKNKKSSQGSDDTEGHEMEKD